MSVFYRPRRLDQAQELWCRCDNCRWSGPFSAFRHWSKAEHQVDVCRHIWCRKDAQLEQVLEQDGWEVWE